MNSATLDVVNSPVEKMLFNTKEIWGILNLRSVGYYKIKHGVLQQSLSKYFRFESAYVLCELLNKFVNTLKKEKEESDDKFFLVGQRLWKEKNMSDKRY